MKVMSILIIFHYLTIIINKNMAENLILQFTKGHNMFTIIFFLSWILFSWLMSTLLGGWYIIL